MYPRCRKKEGLWQTLQAPTGRIRTRTANESPERRKRCSELRDFSIALGWAEFLVLPLQLASSVNFSRLLFSWLGTPLNLLFHVTTNKIKLNE